MPPRREVPRTRGRVGNADARISTRRTIVVVERSILVKASEAFQLVGDAGTRRLPATQRGHVGIRLHERTAAVVAVRVKLLFARHHTKNDQENATEDEGNRNYAFGNAERVVAAVVGISLRLV
jgi:hypothetical protein